MAITSHQGTPGSGMSLVCPPAAVSGNPRSVTAPVGPLQPGGTRLSNLDMNDRLVKRGRTVSYHGVRARVTKVSRGRCHVEYVHHTGRPTGSSGWLVCESVQVVL